MPNAELAEVRAAVEARPEQALDVPRARTASRAATRCRASRQARGSLPSRPRSPSRDRRTAASRCRRRARRRCPASRATRHRAGRRTSSCLRSRCRHQVGGDLVLLGVDDRALDDVVGHDRLRVAPRRARGSPSRAPRSAARGRADARRRSVRSPRPRGARDGCRPRACGPRSRRSAACRCATSAGHRQLLVAELDREAVGAPLHRSPRRCSSTGLPMKLATKRFFGES